MAKRKPIAVFLLLLVPAVSAADKRHLEMLRDAEASFDKVAKAPSPVLADASACVQTQAGMVAVALPAEEQDLHYRKGFCELTVAAITGNTAAYNDAAAELDRAGSFQLAWVSRRAAQSGDSGPWKQPDRCPETCEPFVGTAKLWLGLDALQRDDLDEAVKQFDYRPAAGWSYYVGAQKAFRAGKYSEAVTRYRDTLAEWTRAQHIANAPLSVRLAPPSDVPLLLADLGGAQLLAGDPKGAIVTLDQAVRIPTPSARAYFLRARAKEMAGQPGPALADYNLASRAAFASAVELASGEAHLYRGILFYRRKDFARAEEEFSSALNLVIPGELRTDVAAWRYLSAVALGFCSTSRQFLERALPTVSPFFPKAEAQAMASGCRSGAQL